MVDHVARKLATDVPPEVIEAHRELLVMLGVVPTDFDYVQSLLDLMGAQLAGFYEPDDRTMYLAADLPAAEMRATLSHELVHALQDQHFDLGKHLEYAPDRSDERSAIHALAEGDAMSAMLDDVLAVSGRRAIDLPDALIGAQVRSGVALDPKSARVPSVLRASVVAPYVDGTVFVNGLRRAGGWKRVDEVWRALPATTEQVLHPEKLATREPAVIVPAPTAPRGVGWKLLYRDVLGEQSVVLTLDEWMPRGPAELAASGWGGDTVAVFSQGARYAFAWHVKYDDRATARRGYEAFAAALGDEGAGGARRCVERPDRGPLAVAHRGVSVVLVGGPISRNGPEVRADGDCQAAERWARDLAAR